MAENLTRYLDPKVLSKLSRMELKARRIVEGYISGLHRSPYHGFSVEFAEHREYVPGDDVRHVDWKVFGRSDRFYIKQYEEETNLTTHILLDASESMRYGSDGVSKYEYGTYVAASLAYLLLRQQDAVGLALFDDRVRNFVAARSTPSHLASLLSALDEPQLREKTDVGTILHEFASRIKKRGLIVIISDMFDDLAHVERGMKHLRYCNHEVILFHVLASDEVSFPFQRMTMFEGLEGYEDVLVNPPALRKAYLEELKAFLEDLRRVCRANRFDYVRLDTQALLDVALSTYLAKRTGSLRR